MNKIPLIILLIVTQFLNSQSINGAWEKYKTNSEIGIPSNRIFEKEVENYAFMWREAGQFSRKN